MLFVLTSWVPFFGFVSYNFVMTLPLLLTVGPTKYLNRFVFDLTGDVIPDVRMGACLVP